MRVEDLGLCVGTENALMQKHKPLPWRIMRESEIHAELENPVSPFFGPPVVDGHTIISDGDKGNYGRVCDMFLLSWSSESDAEFICHACNNYYRLIDHLEKLVNHRSDKETIDRSVALLDELNEFSSRVAEL